MLILAGCGHAPARTELVATSPSGAAAPAVPQVEEERADVPAATASATRITFDEGEEAEPTTMVRSAPKRPPIPAFQLFGTRASDGP